MKRPIESAWLALALAASLGALPAVAQQRNGGGFEEAQRFCASGRSRMDFDTCMWQAQQNNVGSRRSSHPGHGRNVNNSGNNNWGHHGNGWDGRNNGWNDNGWNNNNAWNNNNGNNGWRAPPSSLPRQPHDVLQQAINNCSRLQPSRQLDCQARVLSTLR